MYNKKSYARKKSTAHEYPWTVPVNTLVKDFATDLEKGLSDIMVEERLYKTVTRTQLSGCKTQIVIESCDWIDYLYNLQIKGFTYGD